MPTTARDLQALHYLAQRLRSETPRAGEWHDSGLTAVLARLTNHNLATTIERVVRHAADPQARTPAAIERPFVPGPPTAEAPRPPGPGQACPHHPGGWRGQCANCAADRLAGDTAPPPPAPARTDTTAASRVAALRHTVDTTRARLCPCGVPTMRCTEHRDAQ